MEDLSCVIRVHIFELIGGQILGIEIVVKVAAVYHGNAGVKLSKIFQLFDAFRLFWVETSQVESEGFCSGEWFRNTCALNHQVIELSRFCQLRNLLKKIFSESAADTSILHTDEFLLSLHESTTGNKRRVNVELCHVINDEGTLQVLFVFQNMLQQCGFARSKEARNNSDRKLFSKLAKDL